MITITGKIKDDALIKYVNSKEVVVFTIEHMEKIPKKGVWESKFTYWECSYWEAPKSVDVLKKDKAVQVVGPFDVYAYLHDGMPKAGCRIIVKSFEFLPTNNPKKKVDESQAESGAENANDDIPF